MASQDEDERIACVHVKVGEKPQVFEQTVLDEVRVVHDQDGLLALLTKRPGHQIAELAQEIRPLDFWCDPELLDQCARTAAECRDDP